MLAQSAIMKMAANTAITAKSVVLKEALLVTFPNLVAITIHAAKKAIKRNIPTKNSTRPGQYRVKNTKYAKPVIDMIAATSIDGIVGISITNSLNLILFYSRFLLSGI